MFSRFFIERPIFASVISILITLIGLAAYFTLPVEQLPNIVPPVVRVTTTYPGASADVVADTVAAPIEQEVNGVDKMIYMNSTSASDGSYQLDVSFAVGTDVDMATVLVQNRVSIAQAKLPEEVKRQGVTTKKQSSAMAIVAAVYSPDGRYDDIFLVNYVMINLKDQLARTSGVGDVMIFPSKDYGMRIWLDPEKLRERGLTTNDVIDAIREQNVQVAAGRIGAAPAPKGTPFELTVTTKGRLSSADEFGEIILRSTGGRLVRVKDVGRVELGAKAYTNSSVLSGKPAATIIIYQAPGANSVQLAADLKKAFEGFKENFPQGMDYALIYDVSAFIETAVHEVFKTLEEAVILVVLVVLIFLQSLRATFIPTIVIPVALVGTFAAMAPLGFSINMLTLFGLVLAIGIVVDDAIVVVENMERVMAEEHLPPKEASIKAMGEVFGPIISISLVSRIFLF